MEGDSNLARNIKKVTICIEEKHIAIVTIDAPPMNP